MKVLITNKEHNTLTDIRGMPDNVFSMVMAANRELDQYALDGDQEDFDDLLGLISEEIGEGFCPKKNISGLIGVCRKVDPSSLDWIGQ